MKTPSEFVGWKQIDAGELFTQLDAEREEERLPSGWEGTSDGWVKDEAAGVGYENERCG